MRLEKKQAARLLLKKQGLMGKRRFKGKSGIAEFVSMAGCVQYDPINVCGRSPELTLLSRIDGYDGRDLYDLLYDERALFDYYDKNMSIVSASDLRFFSRKRRWFAENARPELKAAYPAILEAAGQREFFSPADISIDDKISWNWGRTSTVASAAAEQLYLEGRLVIHHKSGAVRFYALPDKTGMSVFLTAPDPNVTDAEYYKWAIRRRVFAVGMLADRASDAFLGIYGLKAGDRARAFRELETEGALFRVEVDGKAYFIDMRDRELCELAASNALRPGSRCELIAPLDSFIWDRRLIREIFDFDYTWEIYTPKEKRVYGYYVLPVVYGDRFAGRAEPVADRKNGVLNVNGFWPEKGFKATEGFKGAFEKSLKRLADMNGCGEVKTNCDIY